MDGETHYRMATNLLARTADPEPEDEGQTYELLMAANVHMTAALLAALAPELAKKWEMP